MARLQLAYYCQYTLYMCMYSVHVYMYMYVKINVIRGPFENLFKGGHRQRILK